MPSKPGKPTAAQIRYARIRLWRVAKRAGLVPPDREKFREAGLKMGIPAPCNMRKLTDLLKGAGEGDTARACRVREVWRGVRRLPKTWTYRGVPLRDETWPGGEA